MNAFDFNTYDFKRSLVLCGPTGTGKTYKANDLLNQFKESLQEKSVLDSYSITDGTFKQYVKSNQLCLRGHQDYSASITLYPLEMMIKCKLLIYDDLGVSDSSKAYIRDLTYVLDERIKKGFSTIFTTNLSKKELTEQLNERIVSRLLFNADIVIFAGEDKRLATTNVYNYLPTKPSIVIIDDPDMDD